MHSVHTDTTRQLEADATNFAKLPCFSMYIDSRTVKQNGQQMWCDVVDPSNLNTVSSGLLLYFLSFVNFCVFFMQMNPR
jgi:hypothetical protein